MPTRVTLAGELGIEVDGVAVDMRPLGRVGRLFWAFLVCERHRAVARDELAEVLWGEDELPRSWEQMLRGNASKLRATLVATGRETGVEVVSAFGAYQVRLPADAVVDVEEAAADVEHAAAALRAGSTEGASRLAAGAAVLVAGGFLPGWSGVWVERRQAELRELRLRALEVVGESACVDGRWKDAIAAAEEAVTVEPFRESAYQILMAAHRGAGSPGEALRAYERCRRVLAEDLGVSPSAATEKAYLAILNDGAGPASADSAQVPLAPAMATTPARFLVGREVELERLRGALGRVSTETRQAVLVAGEPGIGKTALVAELAREAHGRGATVLYGRCDEDVGVAYQPFAEAIGHYVANCDRRELEAHVAANGAELSRIAPQLLHRVPDTPPPVATGSEGDRYRLFEAVSALVHAAAQQRQVVIVLDDLHWAGPPTLMLLRHVLRSPTRSLLVLATYRHTEVQPDGPLAATLADLRREPGVERILLEGLDEAGVSAFIEQAEGHALDAGGQALARALHARTAGNPFFVGEFLRHLHESGAMFQRTGAWSYYEDAEGLGVPEGVRDVVARRLGRLSDEATRVLTLAAVVGLDFDLPLIERLAESAAVDAALDALDEAVVARVVSEVGSGRYQFAHALVRDTIYSALTATRRARLHHRVGDALASLPGDPGPRLPAIAHHFAEAATDGGALRAGDYALAAAQQAFSNASWEDALSFADRGLNVLSTTDPEHLDRRFELLVIQQESTGILMRAKGPTSVIEAAEVAHRLGSPDKLARAASLYVFGTGGSDPRGVELAHEALRLLGDSHGPLRARVLAALSICPDMRRSGQAEPQAKAALALARESGDRDAIHGALFAYMYLLTNTPRARERLAIEDELLALGPTTSLVSPGGRFKFSTGRGRAITLLILGDRTGFEAELEAVESRYLRIRNPGLGAQVMMWRNLLALLDGRFGEVPARAASIRESSPMEVSDVMGESTVQMFRLAFERGRVGEYKAELQRVWTLLPPSMILTAMVALAHVETGDTEAARRVIDELAADDFERVVGVLGRSTAFAYVAETVTALGDGEMASTVYEHLAPFTGLAPSSALMGHCPGAVDRYLGQLAATLGRWTEAEKHYEAALVFEEGLRSPPLLARTRYWYGRMLLERDQPGDATRGRDLLDRAAEMADDLGMDRLAVQAAELL